MDLDDYWSRDQNAEDRFYTDRAAVLQGFSFDRLRYRVSGSSFRSTDMTHWLALETVSRALADAGFPEGEGLPRRTTGVVIGNSLTGEFSRANVLRLRWPYVRKTVSAALLERGWDEEDADRFLVELESSYKAPFPRMDEDSLAGGLSNTIAGRVCNHFDLAGGGYTVDGACSSSLLSVATAATALAQGDLDVAIAGGVDLSIDPFEMVGFARTGALATGDMRVYDKASNGFWPGEGAGALVLLREEDAIARRLRSYALITGWGVSSDGRGGITRPEEEGHRLALERAYRRAGYGIDTVGYFEGHGTGTALGDATEIAALSGARARASSTAPPAALGSIKANIGHTKAAAGVAGLIKAALSVYHRVIPPASGHHDPHPLLTESTALRVPDRALTWPEDRPVRAGVSAMGFGGVNTHVTIEAVAEHRGAGLTSRVRAVEAGRQDAEVLFVDGTDLGEVRHRLLELAETLPLLSYAELTDLAASFAERNEGRPARAAVVASSPEAAHRAVNTLVERLDAGETEVLDTERGLYLAHRTTPPVIRYLFPGQGSGDGGNGAFRRRFAALDRMLGEAGILEGGDHVATEVAQPRIVSASLAALSVLADLGIRADGATGHSLGELTSLHWAGAVDARETLALAVARGRAMAGSGRPDGAMAGLACSAEVAAALLDGEADVVVAGYNGPRQTVVSGVEGAVERVRERARAAGVDSTRLNVSHAFHSPLVADAAEEFGRRLDRTVFDGPTRGAVSTVTGRQMEPDTDVRLLLREQIVLPVRFHDALVRLADGADLMVEVGPGQVLTGLASAMMPDVPVVSTDTDAASLAPFLRAVAAAYVLGAPVDTRALFTGRLFRPLPERFTFLANPCESVPSTALGRTERVADTSGGDGPGKGGHDGGDTLELLRARVAARAELPPSMVGEHTRPLDDLHLSSITVGQMVNEVTRHLELPPLEAVSGYATATLGELAGMIDALSEVPPGDTGETEVPGVAPWVRAFEVCHVSAPPVRGNGPDPVNGDGDGDGWSVYAPLGHPLAEPLRQGLSGMGPGVLLCLPQVGGSKQVRLLLDAARAAVAADSGSRFVVVQGRRGAAGVARTLHQEAPGVVTTLVTLENPEPRNEADHDEVVGLVAAEVAATTGFTEVCYDADRRRTVSVLRALPQKDPEGEAPLGPEDVVLVTGGGKGITAECALSLATEYGAALALVGRASEKDPELAANLERMTRAGARLTYVRADVTRPEEVREAVRDVRERLGEITAVFHGAGRNEPAALHGLTERAFHDALAPKVDGLDAVLQALAPERLRLLVSFGSIIGRAGLRGEAHYSTANDWLTEMVVEYGRTHPHVRVLALEWSVWAGTGMGERMGVVETLMRDGIAPISVEEGTAVLHRVLSDRSVGPVLVVSGRTGALPTITMERPEVPLGRFTERILVHYPWVELITEAVLSVDDDPYLADHGIDGDLLFPAVLGMEAMAQVAAAVSGHAGAPVMESVRFTRPVTVRPGSTTTIRVAALVRDARSVDVALFSEETGYAAEHFRARLRWPEEGARPLPLRPAVHAPDHLPRVPLEPSDLYEDVLFQGKRFHRLLSYRRAGARSVIAELSSEIQEDWFGTFMPQERRLADPGTRDAVMHALQVCVPHGTLLPEGVERLHPAEPGAAAGRVLLHAKERFQEGDSYVYDVELRGPSGAVVESWEGLRLRAVRTGDGSGPWIPSLLGPYLERRLEQVLGGTRAVVVEPAPPSSDGGLEERRQRTELAVGRALGHPVRVSHRPDGRPEVAGALVSAAHGAGVTLVVAGGHRLACDVETVARRSEQDWAGLLGGDLMPLRDLVTVEAEESSDTAGTRVWGALECLRKAGEPGRSLTLGSVGEHGWVVFACGGARVATWTTVLEGRPAPVVFAVLHEGE